MFRRKEEGSPETASDLASAPLSPTPVKTGGASSSDTVQASPAQSTQASQAPSAPVAGSQPPQMQPVVRSLSDVTRASAANASGSSYRPSSVSEFNRGVTARGAQETGRQIGHGVSANSNDKTALKSTPRILTVGNDILLKGEIATCDRVVIEGRVEAKLSDVHTVEIAGCGSFKGTAEVEDAEVSGLFEGDLAVKNRLVIYSTGEVRGNVTYGEIEVERGGKLTGQIRTVASAAGGSGDKQTLLDVLDIKSRSSKEAAEG